jgi:putative endopeptidase
MRQAMRRSITAFVLVSLPLAGALAWAQAPSGATAAAAGGSGLDLNALDRAVDPCTDFYRFACGTWTASNPIPSDRSRWGRFDELQERNFDILHRILDEAAAGRDPESKKIGDYYASCMDEAAVQSKGLAALQPESPRSRTSTVCLSSSVPSTPSASTRSLALAPIPTSRTRKP